MICPWVARSWLVEEVAKQTHSCPSLNSVPIPSILPLGNYVKKYLIMKPFTEQKADRFNAYMYVWPIRCCPFHVTTILPTPRCFSDIGYQCGLHILCSYSASICEQMCQFGRWLTWGIDDDTYQNFFFFLVWNAIPNNGPVTELYRAFNRPSCFWSWHSGK